MAYDQAYEHALNHCTWSDAANYARWYATHYPHESDWSEYPQWREFRRWCAERAHAE